MKICRLCKYPNADKNNYCEECNLSFKGEAVRKKYDNEKERGKKNTSGSKKSSFLNVVGICLLLVVSIGSYVYINQGISTYNKAVELWNDGEIQAAMDVAKEVSENSSQYKNAQKLIEISEDYFLYSEAVELWNERNYEDALKIFSSFTEDSEYYMQAQNVLNDM